MKARRTFRWWTRTRRARRIRGPCHETAEVAGGASDPKLRVEVVVPGDRRGAVGAGGERAGALDVRGGGRGVQEPARRPGDQLGPGELAAIGIARAFGSVARARGGRYASRGDSGYVGGCGGGGGGFNRGPQAGAGG